MNPTRRMNVHHRHREQQLPTDPRQPPANPPDDRNRATAEHMVATLDPVQQRRQMLPRPRPTRRRDQHQRMLGPAQKRIHARQTKPLVGHQHFRVGRPPSRANQVDQAERHPVGARLILATDHDHMNPGPRHRLAPQDRRVRIVLNLALARIHRPIHDDNQDASS